MKTSLVALSVAALLLMAAMMAQDKTACTHLVPGPDEAVICHGVAQLKEGQAAIILPKCALDEADPKAQRTVFLSPMDECNGVAVSGQSAEAITIVELRNGKSNATISWMVIVARKAREIPR